jgi:hypothetical protein
VGDGRHVHVVELAEADQLGLARQELDLPLLAQPDPPLDLDVLLGRHREEHHVPVQLVHHRLEAHPGAQHRRHLGVVPAGVGGVGGRVGERMPRDDQRVQLAQDRDRRAGAPPGQPGLDAGEREPRAVLHAHLVEPGADELGGPRLPVARLGVALDVLADRDDLGRPPVDLRAHPGFQGILVRHRLPCLPGLVRPCRGDYPSRLTFPSGRGPAEPAPRSR